MRVIHVVPAITEEASGPSYSVVRLCESLIGQGQEVTLAALDLAPMQSPPSCLKAFPLGWGPPRLGRSPAMRRWLDGQVRSKSLDLLHNHGMWQMNAIYPGWAAKKSNINFVVSPRGAFSKWAMRHGTVMKKVFWPALQRPALEHTACFHATAESEYEDIRRMGFRQPVAIIPNGIDIPDLPPKKWGDFRTVLFLGRLHRVKGLDMLLPAWRAVQDRFPDWRLVIAGSDIGYYRKSGYLEELYRLVQKLGLERIEFVGGLYGAEKTQAYYNADLYILPSYSENFGVTVAEALAAGTPAIVSKGAPWGGLVTQQAGWWSDVSLDALVACLEDALGRSPDELEQMGLRGRNWMETEFSWTRIGAQMADTYRWLLDKSLPDPAGLRVD
ncbi:glycosyltransferase [Methylococcus mesophilus]|uniref:glycosyltransferase n=1 Tax=Methylococcus mesophilus TaxID=2993564 RepID=UPI00224AC9F2|nr:glycosyltransferase [Methylococcus mesophilus]UZR28738.1 glycosyltransferase [Methylococcus mesophilus]